MPSNSTDYDRKYYEEVTKPKRKQKQAEKIALLQQQFTETAVVTRKCPKCGKIWEETLTKPPVRKVKAEKQCHECSTKAKLEYQKKPEVRAQVNARLRKKYAGSVETRKRRAEYSRKWRAKKKQESEEKN